MKSYLQKTTKASVEFSGLDPLDVRLLPVSRMTSNPPPPPPIAGFRYFRLYVTNTGGTVLRIYDMRFSGDPNGNFPPNMTANNAPSPWIVSDNGVTNGSYPLYQAVDGSTGTHWRTTASATVGYPLIVTIDGGASASLKPTALNFDSGTNYRISDALVQCSNDGSSWTTICTITGGAALSNPLTYP